MMKKPAIVTMAALIHSIYQYYIILRIPLSAEHQMEVSQSIRLRNDQGSDRQGQKKLIFCFNNE